MLKTLGADFDLTHSVNALQQLRVSETRAERILESIGDAVIVTDEHTLVTRMNRVAEELTGWPLRNAKGQPLSMVFNIVNEATRFVVESPADKVKRLGTVVGLANHTVLIARNGTEKNIDDSGAPIRDESGRLTGIVLVFRDITEKYKLERAAAEESKRREFLLRIADRQRQLRDPREIMEATAELLARYLDAERVGYAEAYTDQRIFGFQTGWAQGDLQRLTGSAAMESFGTDVLPRLRAGRTIICADIAAELSAGYAAAFQLLGIRAAIIVPLLRNSELRGTLYVNTSSPRIWTTMEISLVEEVAERAAESVERAQIEAELRLSAERLRLATKAAKGMGVFDWHVKSDQFFGDEAFLEIFGLRAEYARKGVTDLGHVVEQMHPDDRPGVEAAITEAMRSGHDYVKEYRVASENGTRWVSARGCCMLDEQGQPERFPGVVVDITERKQSEEDLRTSEANLSLAVDTAKLGIWSLNVGTNALKASAVCKENFGYAPAEDFTYRDLLKATHPNDMASVHSGLLEVARSGTEYRREERIFWPDGSLHWLLSSARLLASSPGQPLTVLGVNLNITDRKLAEGALIQNEKLAAVGKLASSIAHEINNPLESVTNLLYLARSTQEQVELRGYLEVADAELRRVSAITSHTLRFHKQATNPVRVSGEDLVGGVLAIHMGRVNNAQITVERKLQAGCSVFCFDGEIRQVLGNLVGNAIDAMAATGGRLLIRSREGHDWRTDRKGIVLTIADTGSGISTSAVRKIFEAFFTTKGISGTGLGLWISKEIVERHHGRIIVRSSQGSSKSGTVFMLFLPCDAALR